MSRLRLRPALCSVRSWVGSCAETARRELRACSWTRSAMAQTLGRVAAVAMDDERKSRCRAASCRIVRPSGRCGESALGCDAEACGERAPLALGHRADRLALFKPGRQEQPSAPHPAPMSLAGQYVTHRHAFDLPRVEQDHLGGADTPVGDAPL